MDESWSAHFDARNHRLTDNPVLMLDDVQDEIANGTVQFAVSENGTLVYQQKHGGNVGRGVGRSQRS